MPHRYEKIPKGMSIAKALQKIKAQSAVFSCLGQKDGLVLAIDLELIPTTIHDPTNHLLVKLSEEDLVGLIQHLTLWKTKLNETETKY